MPAPYSYDLRRKVIEAIDAGRKKLKSVNYSTLVGIQSICG